MTHWLGLPSLGFSDCSGELSRVSQVPFSCPSFWQGIRFRRTKCLPQCMGTESWRSCRCTMVMGASKAYSDQTTARLGFEPRACGAALLLLVLSLQRLPRWYALLLSNQLPLICCCPAECVRSPDFVNLCLSTRLRQVSAILESAILAGSGRFPYKFMVMHAL